jgi:hypothetical protein
VNFELYLVNDGGEVRVNAKFNCGNAIFLERVNVIELDSGGHTVGVYTSYIRDYFGPGNGSNFLFAHKPSGGNVRQVTAKGQYIEIDQSAASNTVTLP